MDLPNKTAVITGAAGGIGSATVRELADAGMRLVITGRDCGPLDDIAREVGSDRVATLAGDIADPAFPAVLHPSVRRAARRRMAPGFVPS